MNDLQRAYYHRLRANWEHRTTYTARVAFDLARRSALYAISRRDFYARVKLG